MEKRPANTKGPGRDAAAPRESVTPGAASVPSPDGHRFFRWATAAKDITIAAAVLGSAIWTVGVYSGVFKPRDLRSKLGLLEGPVVHVQLDVAELPGRTIRATVRLQNSGDERSWVNLKDATYYVARVDGFEASGVPIRSKVRKFAIQMVEEDRVPYPGRRYFVAADDRPFVLESAQRVEDPGLYLIAFDLEMMDGKRGPVVSRHSALIYVH